MDLWITQLWITMSKPSIVMKNLMCASIVQQDMPPPCLYLHIVQECTEWIKQVIFDHLINYQIICEFDILFWHTLKKSCCSGWKNFLKFRAEFEITRPIYTNYERSKQLLKQNHLLTCYWRFLHPLQILERLKCQLEQIIGM